MLAICASVPEAVDRACPAKSRRTPCLAGESLAAALSAVQVRQRTRPAARCGPAARSIAIRVRAAGYIVERRVISSMQKTPVVGACDGADWRPF